MIQLVIATTGVWLSFLQSAIVPNDHRFASGPPGAELQPFLANTGGKLWSKALYFRVVPLSAVFYCSLGTALAITRHIWEQQSVGTHGGTKWILGV